MNIFVTGDDRKEPLRYKEPLLHTVISFLYQGFKVYLEQGLGVFRVEHPLPTITRKEFKIQENIVSISRKPLPVLWKQNFPNSICIPS